MVQFNKTPDKLFNTSKVYDWINQRLKEEIKL